MIERSVCNLKARVERRPSEGDMRRGTSRMMGWRGKKRTKVEVLTRIA